MSGGFASIGDDLAHDDDQALGIGEGRLWVAHRNVRLRGAVQRVSERVSVLAVLGVS